MRTRLFFAIGMITACTAGPQKAVVQPQKLPPSSVEAPSPPKAKKDFWQGRSDVIRPPQTKPATALTLPAIERQKLKNGLSLLFLQDKQLPLVDVHLLLGSGSIDEPPEKIGLSVFTAEMLRQGTRGMDADTLSETIDSAGGSLHVSSDYETTRITCKVRSPALELCLRLVSDLALRPTFPQKEMGEVRDKLLGEVKEERDDPATLAELHFHNMLYTDDHPAGRPMTAASVQAISRPDLVAFYHRQFVPGRALLGLSGDLDPKKASVLVKRYFGPWKGPTPPPRRIKPVQDPPAGLHVLLVDKPDLTQSFFALGHAGIRRADPDRDAVIAMNYVLGGGGFSSRLMKVVRSEGGKTYGIHSGFEMNTDDGHFIVQSFTRNAQLVSTLRLVQRELLRQATVPPTGEEIRMAKGNIAGGYAIRFQTSSTIIQQLMTVQIMGLPDAFFTEFPLRIEGLTPARVAQAAKDHVRGEHIFVAIVGKAAEVAPLLRAAKISFEQIGYLDPISAGERRHDGSAPK